MMLCYVAYKEPGLNSDKKEQISLQIYSQYVNMLHMSKTGTKVIQSYNVVIFRKF